MSRKIQLLDILAGETCPVCGGRKLRQSWSCADCGRTYRSRDEHAELEQTCAAHMKAADRYLSALLHKRAEQA